MSCRTLFVGTVDVAEKGGFGVNEQKGQQLKGIKDGLPAVKTWFESYLSPVRVR